MYRGLCKWFVLLPVHYLRREWMLKWLKFTRSIRRMDEVSLDVYVKSRLSESMARAVQQGVFSNEIVDVSSLNEENVHERLKSLPFQRKSEYRIAHQKNGKPNIKSDLRSTSGSTGEPFRFHKSRDASGAMDAVQYSAFEEHGIFMGDKQARFWGMPSDRKGRIVAKLKDFIKNRIRFSAFDLSDKAKFEFVAQLERFQPVYFYGYPSLMLEFAQFLVQNNIVLSFPIKAIIGTGEYAYPDQIALIEDAFNSKFLSEYGCTEIGLISFSCDQGKMHVRSENVFLEVISEGVPVIDKEGEICVTELNSKYLPFVRYCLGDRGILKSEKCKCGSSFPVMEVSAGRIDDYILTPSGKRIYDAILAYTLTKGVLKFKAFQVAIDRLRILIIAENRSNSELFDKYKSELQAMIGDDVVIEFEFVDEIPKDKSGKQRYFVSEIKD